MEGHEEEICEIVRGGGKGLLQDISRTELPLDFLRYSCMVLWQS
jgi:hypothetical protein